jgi:hypothetical protein
MSGDMPRKYYAGEFDLTQIPIIRLITRNRAGRASSRSGDGPIRHTASA